MAVRHMFKPKTETIKILAEKYPNAIRQLENIFDKPTNIYVDFANVLNWQNKLDWHIELKRLKQFFDSFDTIKSIKFYYGTLNNRNKSFQSYVETAISCGFNVKTKPVKIMRFSIDVSGIGEDSPDVLKEFISKSLLKKLDLETIEFFNNKLRQLNNQGIKVIEERKCNFDVEIGRDMLLDYERNNAENFILWSGDSDFTDPIRQLMKDGKKVFVFAVAGRVAAELNRLGAPIFDIRKIKEFICWKKELPQNLQDLLKSQKDPR